MALPSQQNFGGTTNQNVSKPPPIFIIIPIDDQRHFWILRDVAQPFQLQGPFRLLVDGRVECFSVKNKTDGDDQRLAAGVGRGKVGDAGGAYEP